MVLRPYNQETDREAAHRIWREVGWSDGTEIPERAADMAFDSGYAVVAELEGAPECLVHTIPGMVRYLEQDLPGCVVSAVTTSHVGRRQGLASRLTAFSVAGHVSQGAVVAALGMFDQGYYNQLGFGTGTYDHWVSFDPAQLLVDLRPRPPRRITPDDWEAMHALRLGRLRGHGAVSIRDAGYTRAAMLGTRNAVGLGYYDGPGSALSHAVWCSAQNGERGPYQVRWLGYRTYGQFLELMALLKSLGDQVRLVQMMEPPGIQLQSLLDRPFRQRQATEHSPFAAGNHAVAWWQMRICDLAGCLAQTHLPGEVVRFNLCLSDPIETHLAPGAPWRGVAGEYVVTLGPDSVAERGADPALPTLCATVNAFTRLWLGVAPASALAATDGLQAPADLLHRLDEALRLPKPMPD